MEPKVTIDLEEYNRLKDLYYQFSFLTTNIKIDKEQEVNVRYGNDPTMGRILNIGRINKDKFDFFLKNLLDIDEIIIEKEELVKNDRN